MPHRLHQWREVINLQEPFLGPSTPVVEPKTVPLLAAASSSYPYWSSSSSSSSYDSSSSSLNLFTLHIYKQQVSNWLTTMIWYLYFTYPPRFSLRPPSLLAQDDLPTLTRPMLLRELLPSLTLTFWSCVLLQWFRFRKTLAFELFPVTPISLLPLRVLLCRTAVSAAFS